MMVRKKIMAIEGELYTKELIKSKAADIAEARENELLAEIEIQKHLRDESQENHTAWVIALGRAAAIAEMREKELLACIPEWFCKSCNTVFPEGTVKGSDISCQCGNGLLTHSTYHERKLLADIEAIKLCADAYEFDAECRKVSLDKAKAERAQFITEIDALVDDTYKASGIVVLPWCFIEATVYKYRGFK